MMMRTTTKMTTDKSFFCGKRRYRESNSGPSHYECDALPLSYSAASDHLKEDLTTHYLVSSFDSTPGTHCAGALCMKAFPGDSPFHKAGCRRLTAPVARRFPAYTAGVRFIPCCASAEHSACHVRVQYHVPSVRVCVRVCVWCPVR
eukprot:scaffold61782_cov78-Phaeocystis_antarctica.AAC.1